MTVVVVMVVVVVDVVEVVVVVGASVTGGLDVVVLDTSGTSEVAGAPHEAAAITSTTSPVRNRFATSASLARRIHISGEVTATFRSLSLTRRSNGS